MTIRWFDLAKMLTRQHVKAVHGADVHEPDTCDEPGCPDCRAYWADVTADRAYEVQKEKGG